MLLSQLCEESPPPTDRVKFFYPHRNRSLPAPDALIAFLSVAMIALSLSLLLVEQRDVRFQECTFFLTATVKSFINMPR